MAWPGIRGAQLVQRNLYPCCNSRCLAGLSECNVQLITDATDPRAVFYRDKLSRNHTLYQREARLLVARALRESGVTPSSTTSQALKKQDSLVSVHYSWDCLNRLQQARTAGKNILVHSCIVPSDTPSHLIEFAAKVSPVVYMAEPDLYYPCFAGLGSTVTGSCNFVVAHPVTQPLSKLRPPFLVLDGVGTAQNVGQILRTAFHLGVTSVVASRTSWNNLKGRACRVSMGWQYHMDFHLGDPLSASLAELRTLGMRIYAAEEHFSSPVLPHEPLGDDHWALIVGNEDEGVSKEAVALSDACVSVPQCQGESLNVAHAAAICLYELARHSVLPRSKEWIAQRQLAHAGRVKKNLNLQERTDSVAS